MSAAPTGQEATVFPAIVAGVRAAMEGTFGSILGAAPTISQDDENLTGCCGLIGLISFVGDVNWSFSLILPQETAPLMAKQFAGFDIPFESADMGDVAGELANVIAGDIVAQLDRRKVKAQMSLPLVVRGNDVEVSPTSGTPSARFTCISEQGPFWFKLSIAKTGSMAGRQPGT